jgi:hypothetical protein
LPKFFNPPGRASSEWREDTRAREARIGRPVRPLEVPDVRPSASIACRIAYAPAAFFSDKHVLQDDLEDAVQSVLYRTGGGMI